jgi:hypothetical protein
MPFHSIIVTGSRATLIGGYGNDTLYVVNTAEGING